MPASTIASGWFPTTRDSSKDGWHFDIVGLLAVIGESTIAHHVQAITASSFSRFPRLIPAPQTLLLTKRPNRLPSTKDVVVIGVHSGTYLEELNFFADIIHDIGSLKDYEFRVYNIGYSRQVGTVERLTSKLRVACSTRETNTESNGTHDLQLRGMQRDGVRDATANLGDVENGLAPGTAGHIGTEEPSMVNISMYTFCPLNILTLSSILITISLIVWAAFIHDGVALIALAAMSVSTSLACLSSQWHPELSQRPTKAVVPPGDIVIKTRGAAFVVVHCEEEITRELYAGTEKCRYVIGEEWHKGLVATSTVLLMVSVVLLGNCEWTMQAAIGAAYVLLNLLYWGVPLIAKQKNNWDVRRYNVQEHHKTRGGLQDAHLPYDDGSGNLAQPSFTRTLWYAIQETGEIGWIEAGHLAPKSKAWKRWLGEAKENCDNADWNPVKAKDRLMKEAAEKLKAGSNQQAQSHQGASQAGG